MTEQNPVNTASQGNGADDPNAPIFAPQAVYIKDVSFEAPNGPRAPEGTNTAPTINLNMNTTVNELGPEMREVVLTINLQATIGDKSLWLVELQQAGAFGLRNIPQDDLPRLLGIFCPGYLLPFLLPPVNFDALYNQALAQQQGQQPAASVN
jgi:preprotein translocase subunit SecB